MPLQVRAVKSRVSWSPQLEVNIESGVPAANAANADSVEDAGTRGTSPANVVEDDAPTGEEDVPVQPPAAPHANSEVATESTPDPSPLATATGLVHDHSPPHSPVPAVLEGQEGEGGHASGPAATVQPARSDTTESCPS